MTITPSRVPRKLGDDVPHRKLAFASGGGEGVLFDLVVFQVRQDVVFQLLVVWAADGARTESHHLAGILQGAGGVKGGRGEAADWAPAVTVSNKTAPVWRQLNALPSFARPGRVP